MKYFILFVLSSNLFAETFEVNHKGYIYTFDDGKTSSRFKSEKINFEIPVKPCSEKLTKNLAAHFKSQLRSQTTSTEDIIEVKYSKDKIFIAEGDENGKKLMLFPDRFAKDFLVYKELCKETKK